jgi:crotonobetainyl-CoA hydratase
MKSGGHQVAKLLSFQEISINATQLTRYLKWLAAQRNSDPMTSPIHTNRLGPVLEVTIDRPKANAIDAATSRIMGDVFAGFRDDPDLRVAILTGTGDRFFCPGWDLKAAAAGEAPDSDYGVGGFGGLQELKGLNKPVICAVNGLAFGGGFEIMLSCDIIIAAEHATFALPEINSGTVADAATIKLPRRIPYHVAMELLFTGRRIDTAEAKHWGLINEIVPAADLMDRARALADQLASGPPLVFAAIKEIDRETAHLPVQEAFHLVTTRKLPNVDRLYSSVDQLEGAKAFAEKRKPVWKGK